MEDKKTLRWGSSDRDERSSLPIHGWNPDVRRWSTILLVGYKFIKAIRDGQGKLLWVDWSHR